MTKINIAELILEIVVGRLVLQLPNKDLEKINKIIVNSFDCKFFGEKEGMMNHENKNKESHYQIDE